MENIIPSRTIDRSIGAVVAACLGNTGVRQATIYLSAKFVVKATVMHKIRRICKTASLIVTLGKPNYRQRQFIKACQKAKEPFPVKKIQLKFFR